MPTKIDPFKRVPGCKPLVNHCLQRRWAPHNQEFPVDKVYVVFCRRSRDLYDPHEVDTWVESVHRTAKGAQDCVREFQAGQLREQLEAVLKFPDHSPELPLSWSYKATEVKD